MALKREKMENKAVEPAETKTDGAEMVAIRILPLRAIGGVGGPGTVAQMEKSLAEQYAREGYVEVISNQ